MSSLLILIAFLAGICVIVYGIVHQPEKVIPGTTIVLDRKESMDIVFPVNALVGIVDIQNVKISSTIKDGEYIYKIEKVDRSKKGSFTYQCTRNCVLSTPHPRR